MQMPPNYGEAYTKEFAAAFPAVARATSSTLLPFLLQGVAGDTALNLPDGIHPNAAGHAAIAEIVWRALQPLLKRDAARTRT
jgi:acyl-CoA thioesterase-1